MSKHIPKCDTQKANIVSFNEAIISKSDTYEKDVWIYAPDVYSEYRYILGTKGSNPLICIGINPSSADPVNLDNTMRRVRNQALTNGFDSYIMLNAYAQRTTDPSCLDKQQNEFLHMENMKAFEYILKIYKNPTIWVAWGAKIEIRPYLKNCINDIVDIGNKYNATWVKAGRNTKSGHPHHPLYLRSNSQFEPFDTCKYLESLKLQPQKQVVTK